jgi:hypothetical protein
MIKSKNSAYKLGRELLCWGDEACECFHSEKAHQNIERFGTVCTGLAGRDLDLICICKEYHPKDNLKFLEYRYEESRQRERRRNKD